MAATRPPQQQKSISGAPHVDNDDDRILLPAHNLVPISQTLIPAALRAHLFDVLPRNSKSTDAAPAPGEHEEETPSIHPSLVVSDSAASRSPASPSSVVAHGKQAADRPQAVEAKSGSRVGPNSEAEMMRSLKEETEEGEEGNRMYRRSNVENDEQRSRRGDRCPRKSDDIDGMEEEEEEMCSTRGSSGWDSAGGEAADEMLMMAEEEEEEGYGGDVGGASAAGCGGSAAAAARTLKRPRLVWTPQLHKRFVDAVSHLGIRNAVPKTIMQLMNVSGLTRENVASHLQKYRLYLRRMNHHGNAATNNAAAALFFSSPPPDLHPLFHTEPPTSVIGPVAQHPSMESPPPIQSSHIASNPLPPPILPITCVASTSLAAAAAAAAHHLQSRPVIHPFLLQQQQCQPLPPSFVHHRFHPPPAPATPPPRPSAVAAASTHSLLVRAAAADIPIVPDLQLDHERLRHGQSPSAAQKSTSDAATQRRRPAPPPRLALSLFPHLQQ